jgi:thiol-disulfide isomerase/thioredoxin
MRFSLLITAVLALAACHKPAQDQNAGNWTVPNMAGEPHKGVDRSHKGSAEPAAVFTDPEGKPVKLADFAGKPVLVNLWASWCAPCVKELPTLDQRARSGPVKVLAVSQDDGPHASVVAFLQAHKIATLEPYQDSKMAMSAALGPDTVLPTSILYDSNGKEVWRYVGDLDWTSPDAAKLLAEAGAPAKAS